jgi:type III pantothenate kinase
MYAEKFLLAIDIGNTSTHFARFKGSRIVREWRMSTNAVFKRKNSFRKQFSLNDTRVILIASVVPRAGIFLRDFFKKSGLSVYLLGKDLKPPIVNRYRRPRQVGMDRLMNALAAYRIFRKEAIVIDFGTAITFDIVSRKGEYLGGVIAPGITITLEALAARTALLPKIELRHPRRLVADNTAESIRVGCSYGIGGLCDRIIRLIQEHYRFNPVVVATGGYAGFMKRYCRSIKKIDPRLTLKGIFFSSSQIHQKNT